MASEPTVNPVGRPRGQPKTGGLQKGGVKLRTAAVKLAVLTVFEKVNESDKYLTDIAENDPKLFLSLLARLIPSETNATVDLTQRHVIDLGAAMRDADARLKARQVIEHRPAMPTPVAAPDIAAQPVETTPELDRCEHGVTRPRKPPPETWDGYDEP